MYILGISSYYHDSAACLIHNGEIVNAAQEERFTRIKHDPSFPSNSILFCLNHANILPEQLDYVVFYDKPFEKFDRILETYLAFAPNGFKSFQTSLPTWVKDKLFQKSSIIKSLSDLLGENVDWKKILLFSEHHLSHAASAFFPSPFTNSAILTIDGVGEWVTTSVASGVGNEIEILKEIKFPHSLGLLYSAFTYYTGFKVNSGEYKVMGLAPYGKPIYAKLIKDHLIDIKEDGSFNLDLFYFDYCLGQRMTNDKFNQIFGAPPRAPESPITQKEMDLASSIQFITEEILVKLAKNIRQSTNHKNLCLAGGVALNCVANGRLLQENIFDRIWVQPASGDAGGAIGAALSAYHLMLNQPRIPRQDGRDGMKGALLGPSFTQAQINESLTKSGAVFKVLSDIELIQNTAALLSTGNAIGWMSGQMEFGPRSLGSRSILADPRPTNMQKLLNLKVKFRESFRPFAPAVLLEDVKEWFDIDAESPYMLFVAKIAKSKQIELPPDSLGLTGLEMLNSPRSKIPSVTHVDNSARIQTVDKVVSPKFHSLISEFKKITGIPVLINTSFNVRGEPIVNTPEDAFKCFMGTELDVLVIGNSILLKIDQSPDLLTDYKNLYELD